MSWSIQDDLIGMPPITTVDAAPRVAPGMIAHAVDPVLGGGEFLYLPGVVNTVVGSLVTYNQAAPSTTLAATGAQNGNPVAVAMAAVGAGQWGWFQVTGQAKIAKTAVAISLGAALAISATGGQVAAAGTPGAAGSLDAALCSAAALAGDATVSAQISRPALN